MVERSNQQICLFVNSMRGGGAERVMANLANGLVATGWPVDLVLMERDGPYLRDVPAAVRVIGLHTPSVTGAVIPFVTYLRRERPSIVISALKQASAVALTAKALWMRGQRVYAAIHGNQWKADKRVDRRLGRKVLYHWADGIIAVSRGVAEDFARHSGIPIDRVRVIYNPIVGGNVDELAAIRPPHSWLQDTRPVPVVMALGRLAPEKDFPTLLRAFAGVRHERPCRLVILGEGPERSTLERLAGDLGISEDVSMPGFVDNVYSYLSRADVAVMSSRIEGLPTVIVEAMAVGTSVVSTDCPSGPNELLDGGIYGGLVPVGDSDRLKEAILGALDSPSRPAVLRRRAAEFSISSITHEYVTYCRP